MQVVQNESGFAWCEGMGTHRRVDTLLVGEQPVGTWILVFLDSAREVLETARAEKITAALRAASLATQGQRELDHLFADLVDREPQLPAFLQPTHKTPAGD